MSGAKKHNNDAAEMLCEIKQTSNLYSVCGPNLTRPESDMEEIWLMLDIHGNICLGQNPSSRTVTENRRLINRTGSETNG